MSVMIARAIAVELGGRNVVEDVHCELRTGSVTAILGPNGAGKSSLLRVLAGVERPASGTVRWTGEDWFGFSRRERAREAALVEQDAHAELPLTVRMAVALGRTPHASVFSGPSAADTEIVDRAIAEVGMTAFADRQISTLSGGERQRAHLARALAQEPRVLFLDEPTNHLDVRAQLSTLSLVRGLARTNDLAVVTALHDLNLAVIFADQVVVLDEGRVAATGAPLDVLTPDLIERVWGVSATILRHPQNGSPVIAFELPAGSAT